jgi:hypothetical protein
MKLLDVMAKYFEGEKIEALVFILPIGLLSLVFGAWLLSDGPSAFARGVAIPFVVMGLVMTVVGGVVGYRTPAQVEALETSIAASPEPAVQAEQARMEKVNRAWPVYLAVWAAFGVAGLALRFATRGDLTQGLGIALVFFAGVGLLVDGFAERRARPYTEALASASTSTR